MAVRTDLVVLVVDDDPGVLSITARGLKVCGATVLTAVILDERMSGMSGAETLLQLRADHPMLPVLLTTGSPDPDLAKVIAHDPCARLLPKPYRPVAALKLLVELSVSQTDGP